MAVTVITASVVSGNLIGGLKSTGRLIVAPFSWTINLVAHPIADLFAGAVNYSDVVRQNEELRSELGRDQLQLNQQDALAAQLQQIASVTNLPFVGSMSTVVAEVTANSPTSFAATVTISRGSSDGVLVGMPVVANGGVLGRVISTTNHTATVQLITDQTSIVGCTFGAGTNAVLVYGRGVNDPLEVSAVTLTTSLTPGTVFSTNALQGGLYPPGLPVAKVSTETLTPGSATYVLKLTPAADLSHLSYVDVLLWEPST